MEQIMKIMPFLAALVTATSIGMATGPAWSDETTQGGSAAQTPATASYPTRGRYPTPPRQRGYMQRWQQPTPICFVEKKLTRSIAFAALCA